ncbi:IS5/IS1182 family transposase [Streptomyces sp. NPDC057486]|uniref:IS5/IS1182 family transposase n=1 Tax=Streptomyces sp. NPDC057486 TaxID=3346145 RepID=UPI0036A1AE8F
MWEIVNALLYQGRTDCQWDLLTYDLPPRGAVKCYFTKRCDDGTDQTIHDLRRWQVRKRARRTADPSLVVLDTQSVHAAAGVPAESTGRDAAKKLPAASAAWPLTCWAWSSRWWCSLHPCTTTPPASRCWTRSPPTPTTVEKVLVDQDFKNAVVAHGQTVGIELEIVERNPVQTGLVPIPKWRIVERAHGFLMLHGRLVRDYEHQPRSSESRVYWALTAVNCAG